MITIRLKGLKESQTNLSPKRYATALRFAVNDISRAVKTKITAAIREGYNVPSGRIKRDITLSSTVVGGVPKATISFGRKPPGLQHYRMIVKTTKGQGTKITVAVKRGEGRKEVAKSFLIKGKVGIFAVGAYKGGRFIRGEGRKPIARLLGPSIGGMYRAVGGYDIAKAVINERFESVFWRQIKRQEYLAGR